MKLLPIGNRHVRIPVALISGVELAQKRLEMQARLDLLLEEQRALERQISVLKHDILQCGNGLVFTNGGAHATPELFKSL